MRTSLLTIRRAALHFSGDVYERYFNGLDSVVLLREGEALVVLPVRHAAGGGYLIKLRSGSGERTVDAADFFRQNGIDDTVELTLPATWRDEMAALVVEGAFNSKLSLQ
jgi:hypothetical protein